MAVNKKKSGATLLELIIAIGVLAIIAAPIFGVFVTGTRLGAAGYKLTVASLTAQMRIEELVGLKKDELPPDDGNGETGVNVTFRRKDNLFNAKTEITFDYEGFEQLALVKVTVYDITDIGETNVLCTQEDVLNVVEGGVE